MTTLNIPRTRNLLQKFDFKTLFIEELGWSQPTNRQVVAWELEGNRFERRQIAHLSGVVVFEISADDDTIPDAKIRRAIHKEIAKHHHENLLIFLGQKRTQSLWYYVKREQGKNISRDHYYFKGQPGDLFLSKISAMVVDITELDERGQIPVFEVASRLRTALDVERVIKRFYTEFQQEHLAFLELISGIDHERDRRWYASVLLNRLMFIYFLQRKGFLDNGNMDYLENKLQASTQSGADRYYRDFLWTLFFEGFAKPEDIRSAEVNRLLGKIKYLNGGLFLEHRIETDYPNISIPDVAFRNLFTLFERYSWNLNDTPGGQDNELNPDVLGYIFEKYINQKAFGAYYTRTEITEYLCERTIHQLILDRINGSAGVPPALNTGKGWHSRGYLPHFDQPGFVQFITFRLGDALPGSVLEKLKIEQAHANKSLARPLEETQIEEERRKQIEAYLDAGHGACHLRNPEIARLVENALLHFDGNRYQLLAWVIMPNHVHVLIETKTGFPLSEIVHSWKSFTAKQANKILKRTGDFWQPDYYDRYIRDTHHLQKAIRYIHENPVKTGLVQKAQEWPFGSAHIVESTHASETLALPRFTSIAELLLNLDARLCRFLLTDVLPNLKLLDPACGSAAFLAAAMKTLINVYSAIVGKIKFLNDSYLTSWLTRIEREHNLAYYIKKRIITDNLFGVDVMEEATEIARLRLFLVLVASAESVEQLEPLPNIDFNILAGNSLIGLMQVNDQDFNQRHAQGNLFVKKYREVLEEKNRLIDTFRHTTSYSDDLASLRDNINQKKEEAIATLNDILLKEFQKPGIKFEEATWDPIKNTEGKPKKRPLKPADIDALKPFHWGYEFDEIINQRGGFDAIITNPPWETFKPQAKEFFAEYSDLVTKNKMTIKDFEKEQAKLLQNEAVRQAWLEYQSRFPHVNLFYRNTSQYKNQLAFVQGKKAATDLNYYKLFLEQSFNLLRRGGMCGIVIPSGIYTDLGAKQLREMLFDQTHITGLFCFENRKEIFEGVDSRFKFVVLTFEKGGVTTEFPTAFMRHQVGELERFPKTGALSLSVELIRRLSPDSLSVMEFKNETDIHIAEKMLRFPLLGEKQNQPWNLELCREFHMTDDSHLFKTEPGPGRLPLYEGKMIHQFTHKWGEPKYWLDEKEARAELVGSRNTDTGQLLDYQKYRLAFREIARNTDERTMIATMLPKKVYANHKLTLSNRKIEISEKTLLFCCAVFDSFAFDFLIRQRVTSTVSMFLMYQLPIPRLTESDLCFRLIVNRAARLICTTPEFDELAGSAGILPAKSASETHALPNEVERGRLRAEIDGLVAHLYGLTEEEFAHILKTFPIVPEPVKVAAQNAYRDVERGLIK